MVKIQNFNRLESDLGASVVKTDVMNGQLKCQIAILVSIFNFVFQNFVLHKIHKPKYVNNITRRRYILTMFSTFHPSHTHFVYVKP